MAFGGRGQHGRRWQTFPKLHLSQEDAAKVARNLSLWWKWPRVIAIPGESGGYPDDNGTVSPEGDGTKTCSTKSRHAKSRKRRQATREVAADASN